MLDGNDATSYVLSHLPELRAGVSGEARSRAEREPRFQPEPLDTYDGICVHSSQSEKNPDDIVLQQRRLLSWELQCAARQALPASRIRVCYRHRLLSHVDVMRRGEPERLRTYYRGLMVCGLVWDCPVCAASISERRRHELAAGVEHHKASGGAVYLLTLTVPHTREDTAFWLTGRLLEAFRKFGQGRDRWTLHMPGYAGSVRALEVTHGESFGWHPHLHVLVCTAAPVDDLVALSSKLFERWRRAVLAVGLQEPSSKAFNLQDGAAAAKYVSKWGIVEEVTKANVKTAAGSNRSPRQLLLYYALGEQWAGALYRQYAEAFKGRSQLQWTPGLKKRLGIGDRTDQELAQEIEHPLDQLAARISVEDWRVIRRHELRARVLETLRRGDWSAVEQLLAPYRDNPPCPSLSSDVVRSTGGCLEGGAVSVFVERAERLSEPRLTERRRARSVGPAEGARSDRTSILASCDLGGRQRPSASDNRRAPGGVTGEINSPPAGHDHGEQTGGQL